MNSHTDSTMIIAVIGFGKIGQGIAAAMLKAGLRVHAVDRDARLVASLHAGEFHSTEPGVQEQISAGVREGRLEASVDLSAVNGCGAILMSIPLGVDDGQVPDASGFEALLLELLPCLSDNVLLLTETSVPVGFNRQVIHGLLEARGRIHGRDYLLAHGPERIKSGSMLHQLGSIPKIIGGLTEEATRRACVVYGMFLPKELLRPVQSLEEAEFSKMAGMLYRDVNIALVNQLAIYAGRTGIDLSSLLPLINSDKEANLLQPGIGVGGHCTPVYPWFLIRNFTDAGLDFSLAREARSVNSAMPATVLEELLQELKGHPGIGRALILGLSFRPGVREHSNSPAFAVRDYLLKQGIAFNTHDPMYSLNELDELGMNGTDDLYATGAELIVLVTMQDGYKDLDWKLLHQEGGRVLLDGRNGVSPREVNDAGLRYVGIGRRG